MFVSGILVFILMTDQFAFPWCDAYMYVQSLLESEDFKHVKKDKSNLTLMGGKIMHHILHAIIFFLGCHLIHAFVTSIQVHLYVHTMGQCRTNYCA